VRTALAFSFCWLMQGGGLCGNQHVGCCLCLVPFKLRDAAFLYTVGKWGQSVLNGNG